MIKKIFKNKSVITTVIAVILLIGMMTVSHKKKPTTPSLSPTLVELSTITEADMPRTTSTVGNLRAHQQTDISAKVGGYISKILFKEGDIVTAGTVLIQLDDAKEKNDLRAAASDAALSQLQYEHDYKAYKKGLLLQEQIYNTKVTNEKNQAIVKSDQTALTDMALTAPFSGEVGSQNINLGDYVTPGQKLVTLVDQKSLRVDYALPSQFAPQVKVGQSVIVTADGLPNKIYPASVTFVSPIIDRDSQTIAVHALLNNDNGDLKPGQFVDVHQTLGTLPHALLVPEQSVLAAENGYHVFTVTNNHAVAVLVKIGEHFMGKVQIVAGLKPNDQIITTGQNQIKDNDPVKVVGK